MSDMQFVHLGLGWIGDSGGGLERYQDGVCCAHAMLGCSVTAWIQSSVAVENSHRNYAIEVYASPKQPRKAKLSQLDKLARRRFEKRDFTFVSHHASVSGSVLKLLEGTRHIVHFQGPWAQEAVVEGAPWWKTLIQSRIERKVYRSADRVITLSKSFAEIAIKQYGVSRRELSSVQGDRLL